VIVGRSPQIRDRTSAGAFIVFSEPLPVGTPIALKIDDKEQFARVTEVVESADEAAAGMRVRFVDSAERPAPAPKPMARVAPLAAPTPAPTPAPPPAAAEPPAAAPAPAAAPEQAAAPVPVAVEGSSASEAVHSTSPSTDSAGHPADPNAHHDGEGGRRRRRRK